MSTYGWGSGIMGREEEETTCCDTPEACRLEQILRRNCRFGATTAPVRARPVGLAHPNHVAGSE